MSRFIKETLTDIRNGRESWRVFVALCGPAFAITMVGMILHRMS